MSRYKHYKVQKTFLILWENVTKKERIMNKKKAALHNLGCKVNSYETEAMQELLEQAGYEIVPFAPGADVYIINTCTVTNMADRKSRQMLHKAKKMNPDAIVVAAGCYVQAAREAAREDEAVDILIGNNEKKDLIQIVEAFERDRKEREWIHDLSHEKDYEELSITHTTEHTRAYIKVQDGCNQFCSYCIIPFTRGRVRSRSLSEVIREVEGLAEKGFLEIVLTGIHLSSYGVDIGSSLLELILKLHEIPGIQRIRLGSLEQGIITEEFVQALKDKEKFCPHFHLSLQSGCDATLQRMNRRYTTEAYLEKCRLLRKYFDHPALTTDVIVGFPGETEEEFAETVEFLKQVAFYETHIFKYSRRKGTKAAVMENQIPEQIKTKRSEELLALDRIHRAAFEERLIGENREVLFEEAVSLDGEEWFVGHTKEYVKIGVKTEKDLSNQIRWVKIQERTEKDLLTGIIIE